MTTTRHLRCTWFLASGLALCGTRTAAQIGEGQLGVVASYGASPALRPGVGLTFGVATGRLAYVGARWVFYFGEQRLAGAVAPQTEIRTRSQSFAVDLAVQIPVGPVEIIPGLSVGALRFSQRSRASSSGGGTSEHSRVATEFLSAPGVSIEVYAGHLAIIPQLQYAFAGNPELASPVAHQAMVASVRVVVTKELGRIRH